jgi:predicted RNase H-like HicB family nuclease
MNKYAIVIEKAENNYSAYVPDIPGCIAVGATIEEVRQTLMEALASHLELMRRTGEPIPKPSTITDYVEVA